MTRTAPRALLWLVAWLSLNLALTSSAAAAEPSRPGEPSAFSFALLGDPQIGFGHGGDFADGSRFREVLDATNARGFPLVVIPGDLVQDRTVWQHWIFQAAVARSRVRPLLAAGNHDVVSEGSLSAFREAYGSDYYRSVFGNSSFLILNSETLRTPELSQLEFDRQWSWLSRTLDEETKAGRAHVFLVAHRPPFADTEDEPDNARGFPRETRTRLLDLMRRHHVQWFLAGHLHIRHETQTSDGIRIVVAPGSARSFDSSPVGYQSFRVEADRVEHQWVTVADPPRPPFVVPGFEQWTPRLFDFSIRHWLFTLAYVAAGLVALRAARAARRVSGGTTLGTWGAIATLLFFFGANMQLDVDEMLQELGRLGARISGIYPIRHVITGSGLALGGTVAALWLGRRFLRSARDRGTTLALAALVVPSAWFCLSTISHHNLGMVLGEETWDLLTIAALATIGATGWLSARRHGSAVRR